MSRKALAPLALPVALSLTACADDSPVGPTRLDRSSFCGDKNDIAFAPSAAPLDDEPLSHIDVEGSSCAAYEREYAIASSPHLPDCAKVSYGTDPPTSGPHYGNWAAFQTYTRPVPRGYYVHSMEHGAVVIVYSCSDCDDEIAAAQAMIDELPLDPACTEAVRRRIILTPDPLLQARWAAAAWGHSLEADCFDLPAFRGFVEAHYALGPENFCTGGVLPSDG
jgi:hypothetical protein